MGDKAWPRLKYIKYMNSGQALPTPLYRALKQSPLSPSLSTCFRFNSSQTLFHTFEQIPVHYQIVYFFCPQFQSEIDSISYYPLISSFPSLFQDSLFDSSPWPWAVPYRTSFPNHCPFTQEILSTIFNSVLVIISSIQSTHP